MKNCYDCFFKNNLQECRRCQRNVKQTSGAVIKSYMTSERSGFDADVSPNVCNSAKKSREIAQLEYRLWQREEEIRRLRKIINGFT